MHSHVRPIFRKMSHDNKTIHDFDFNLICEYFSSVDRQGPGSTEVTVKALRFVKNLSHKSKIVDIGCGTGGQTMVLAQNTLGRITGIDLFPPFVDRFNADATKLTLNNRVNGIVGSMDDLPFRNKELDLIWSEGAIYHIGFERGLREWRKFLKLGGYIAVTDLSWFTEQRPNEIHEFWLDAYPEIDTIPNKIAQVKNAGYLPVATFNLPEDCWTKHFYEPQISAQEIYLRKYAGNRIAEELVFNQRRERALYTKYKAYYGYTFYIAKKIK